MGARTRPARPPRTPAHQFVADPDLPPDHAGRQVCATCHKPGAEGDAQHPNQPAVPPALPERIAGPAAARDAAILGETDTDHFGVTR
jgi:hypothetical protein